MSEFMGMNKLTFLDKYTEEKTVDGQLHTKLTHKKDLSCILLDIGQSYVMHVFELHGRKFRARQHSHFHTSFQFYDN